MPYDSIVISSGHGLYVRGAAGSPIPPCLDEVNEARRVVEHLADELTARGVDVITYADDISKTQDENLNRIVDFHNAQGPHDLDVSVHFNASDNHQGHGVEVLYLTQAELAAEISTAIASVGLTNRGAKYRDNLFFLNQTAAKSVLLEICFCDHKGDCDIYNKQFDAICSNIAELLSGEGTSETAPPKPDAVFHVVGRCSYFGGPNDQGVSASEGLAFYSSIDQGEHLFLPNQPAGTSGLARRLNPHIHYVACRWDYNKTPKEMLRAEVALVKSLEHGTFMTAFPADWGPHQKTGRVADLSPGLMQDLGIETDDEIEVIFPHREDI